MDRTALSIVFAILLVVSLAALAFTISLFVHYPIDQHASVEAVNGAVSVWRDTDIRLTIVPDQNETLRVGETARVEPGSTAAVVFFNGGRAILTGPAALTLTESQRRATSLGHLAESQQYDREYILTLQQTSGSVQYYFDHTDPAFEDLKLTVQLPQGNYRPTTPCWQITIGVQRDVTTEELPCYD